MRRKTVTTDTIEYRYELWFVHVFATFALQRYDFFFIYAKKNAFSSDFFYDFTINQVHN